MKDVKALAKYMEYAAVLCSLASNAYLAWKFARENAAAKAYKDACGMLLAILKLKEKEET